MTPQDFVQKSVAMQLGGVQGQIAQNEAAMIRALKGSSRMAVACLPDQDDLLALDKDGQVRRVSKTAKHLSPKTKGALASICAQGPGFGFIIDMQDRRLRSITEPETAPFPVFCFNRHVEDKTRVLWPLPIYHDLDGDQFLAGISPDTVPWADKIPQMIWRGITGGRAAGRGSGMAEGVRLKAAFRRYAEGKIGERRLKRIMSTAPRYRIVETVKDDARFDFGFVDGDGYVIAKTPFHQHLERPRTPREQMQRCRYIAVLRGLDVGSSFYWVMKSGSLGFVQETPFETFASGQFEPWKHFVPFREDGADLVQHLNWAESNPNQSAGMAREAAGLCQMLERADLRHDILKAVVDNLNRTPRV